MKIWSGDLAKIAKEIHQKIEDVDKRLQIYLKEELHKFGGSNFVLSISDYSKLLEVHEVLKNENQFSTESAFLEKFYEYYNEFDLRVKNFYNEVEQIRREEHGSSKKMSFCEPFSYFINSLVAHIIELYDKFKESLEIKNIIQNKDIYIQLSTSLKEKNDSFAKLLTDTEDKASNLLLSLEQIVAQRNVQDIKKFYRDYQKNILTEKRIYGSLYFITCLAFLTILLILFNNLRFVNEPYLWQKTAITFSFFGFISYLIGDFRKRFNIAKSILDDIRQKSSVVDIYASLLSKIKEFDTVTKESYNREILTNIINSLLALKNNGYAGKDYSSNISPPILELLNKIIKK
ncbi:hypothetical protein [Leptospira noguchii]|uniref:hypothetical protein n=1 Tax=Leptospira noguchii TaxID=28182 RepID=UPI001FB73B37|nr:hypothetical protein [Leptospira noguchii]UOG40341.1 hypothetical protein MAL05_10565 [Leptospira noguchii]